MLACYTFDLKEVVTGLIGVRQRDRSHPARVRVLADEEHTDPMRGQSAKNTGVAFAQLLQSGVEVRTGRGTEIGGAYPLANPGNPRMEERGGHHAKVLIATGLKLAFIGSTNFTQSSQCNIEMTAQIRLTETGLLFLTNWFEECWQTTTAYALSGGSAGSRGGNWSSRSPTRARSRGAPRGQAPAPSPP